MASKPKRKKVASPDAKWPGEETFHWLNERGWCVVCRSHFCPGAAPRIYLTRR